MTALAAIAEARRRTRKRPLGRHLSILGWCAAAVLAVVALLAIFGPLLVTVDPNAVDLSGAYSGPSPEHLLGQDASGRDLFSRLLSGASTSLVGPLLVVVASTVLGTALALSAVWIGGWFDSAIARVIDAVFAFPGLLLAILATSIFGTGLQAAVIALSISYTPYIARIVRGAALRERSLPYVAALRVQGLRGTSISLRHILPNIAGLISANATLSFGFALIDLAALSFIGLGVQAPTADWGAMIGSGMAGILQLEPQEALWASLLIVITVAAANSLGDELVKRSENRS
ncbi:ABC transporter permease [Arthrobacter sp. AZCC_0090]|uniref:ABC transporter permease n=1 Tax=Arthrobacter sp. AZCC_0090 TaxID=2735881 RepID=UPI00160D3903|nr:ABC transporter permease [Arthrobacter sp. AZCC_0090]MBB6406611.1 peptide/nickel transport system permease protein [Arthrobacter sp. AZCC_0090]